MNHTGKRLVTVWLAAGARYLPFADAASAELPLGRLLRLSLFQASVGMALALLIGTLNRVMIVELGIPASLVGGMLALPVLFAPFRALIGFRSDVHRSALGWKRVPFIWKGTLIQFGGFAVMPFALLVLSKGAGAESAVTWLGRLGVGVAFFMVGAGLHTTQTAGLALATDLAPDEAKPKVVGLMYVMLLLGITVSSFVFGGMLVDFSPERLVRVVQAAALATMVLNVIALWKQESRDRNRGRSAAERAPSFREAWSVFANGEGAMRRLFIVGLGTIAFSLDDILLEPYGGEILHLSVAMTTKLTALLAIGGLAGFALASRILGRGADPFRVAFGGCVVGIPAFLAVAAAAPAASVLLFGAGTFLIGFGGGLFGHGTLTATMNAAPRDQRGLALGAWGAVEATSAGAGVGASGILRDVVTAGARESGAWRGMSHAALGYSTVYLLEVVMLLVTIVAMVKLVRRPSGAATGEEGAR